ncbi:MAG TPA: hypothetical protein VGM90_28425 [Kofleriaceae bacterium]|jgi:tetratricopeptide (TPR) repeat protein
MSRAAGFALALGLATGCVTAPKPLDVSSLVRDRGQAGARGELEVRVLSSPRDVQAHLALAKLADEQHRPTEAIEQLEAVLALGGPLGTRWHADDKARFARLLRARGQARLQRGSPSALADLERAATYGEKIQPLELAAGRAAKAVWQVRHVDARVRGEGTRTLAALAADQQLLALFSDPPRPGYHQLVTVADVALDQANASALPVLAPLSTGEWIGATRDAVPHSLGVYGMWLWERGARRAAWEALHTWRTSTSERDLQTNVVHDAYIRALAWWTPLDGSDPPESELNGATRCLFASAACTPTESRAVLAQLSASSTPAAVADDTAFPTTREAALAAFVTARLHELDMQMRSTSATELLPPSVIADLLIAFRRDSGAAERQARDVVALAPDGALAAAAAGTFFSAIGDPARARRFWQAAVDASPEPPFVLGLAIADARAGDPDAALVQATMAAAAWGDPADAWIRVSRALEDLSAHSQAVEAARYAIDLAGRDRMPDALEAAMRPSRELGRDAQAAAFDAQRVRLLTGVLAHPGPTIDAVTPVDDLSDVREAIAAHTTQPTAATTAHLWVVSRAHPRDVELRVMMLDAMSDDDPRHAVVYAEMLALASDPDERVGRAALSALQSK